MLANEQHYTRNNNKILDCSWNLAIPTYWRGDYFQQVAISVKGAKKVWSKKCWILCIRWVCVKRCPKWVQVKKCLRCVTENMENSLRSDREGIQLWKKLDEKADLWAALILGTIDKKILDCDWNMSPLIMWKGTFSVKKPEWFCCVLAVSGPRLFPILYYITVNKGVPSVTKGLTVQYEVHYI